MVGVRIEPQTTILTKNNCDNLEMKSPRDQLRPQTGTQEMV